LTTLLLTAVASLLSTVPVASLLLTGHLLIPVAFPAPLLRASIAFLPTLRLPARLLLPTWLLTTGLLALALPWLFAARLAALSPRLAAAGLPRRTATARLAASRLRSTTACRTALFATRLTVGVSAGRLIFLLAIFLLAIFLLAIFLLAVFLLAVFLLAVFLLAVFLLTVFLLTVFLLAVARRLLACRPHVFCYSSDLFGYFPFGYHPVAAAGVRESAPWPRRRSCRQPRRCRVGAVSAERGPASPAARRAPARPAAHPPPLASVPVPANPPVVIRRFPLPAA
jgi:hypothetical protein